MKFKEHGWGEPSSRGTYLGKTHMGEEPNARNQECKGKEGNQCPNPAWKVVRPKRGIGGR